MIVGDRTRTHQVSKIAAASPPAPLLSVEDLSIGGDGGAIVQGVSFSLQPGETLGIVGESGSGKSLTCRAVLGVLPPGLCITGGSIRYKGTELVGLDRRGWAPLRGRSISAVFQDPGSYLNPSIPVGRQLAETLRASLGLPRGEAYRRSLDLLRRMGLRDAEAIYRQYPFELSGGMLQRVLIAIAVCAGPELLIADEATTALDVTVQAEVLDLLAELRSEQGLALILVSHDLAVVAQMCPQVLVLRHGAVVEAGPAERVLTDPQHDYTRSLLLSHAQYGMERLPARRRVADTVAKQPGRPAITNLPGPLLQLRGVHVAYGRGRASRRVLHAVDLTVGRGETIGLIGETGSGKTTLLRAILGVARLTEGSIRFDGAEIGVLRGRALRDFRRSGRLQYVFQDPLQSLDPDMTVGRSIAEGLLIRGDTDRAAIAARAAAALDAVGLDAAFADRLPRELSGGQRQRAVIARALVLDPALLLLDEPVSALDASSRTQILQLLGTLARERGIAQIFISHDLGSVAGVADRVAVLYRGRIVEAGPTADLLHEPRHPYTRLLIGSAPTLTDGAADETQRHALRAALANES
jgi:peptide/nickel transport system ATP-binding protein